MAMAMREKNHSSKILTCIQKQNSKKIETISVYRISTKIFITPPKLRSQHQTFMILGEPFPS